jgi:hypothetical protein
MTPRDNSPADLDLRAEYKNGRLYIGSVEGAEEFCVFLGDFPASIGGQVAEIINAARLQSAPRTGEASAADLKLEMFLEFERLYAPHKMDVRQAMTEWARHRSPSDLIALIRANLAAPGAKEGPKPAEGPQPCNGSVKVCYRGKKFVAVCSCGFEGEPCDLIVDAAPAAWVKCHPGAAPSQPQHQEALRWTRERPKVAGWYWYRVPGTPKQSIDLFEIREGMLCWYSNERAAWVPLTWDLEWAGPIAQPPSPDPASPPPVQGAETQTNQGAKS